MSMRAFHAGLVLVAISGAQAAQQQMVPANIFRPFPKLCPKVYV